MRIIPLPPAGSGAEGLTDATSNAGPALADWPYAPEHARTIRLLAKIALILFPLTRLLLDLTRPLLGMFADGGIFPASGRECQSSWQENTMTHTSRGDFLKAGVAGVGRPGGLRPRCARFRGTNGSISP
jgi:hypothetical protein